MERLKFLVIDDNSRSRLLVVATLARNFPQAIIKEAATIKEALAAADLTQMDAIIGFFGNGLDARVSAHLIRSQNARVPIVIMSEVDCAEEVLGAGATRFLSCDEWLIAGTVLSEILAGARGQSPVLDVCTKKPPVETGGLEGMKPGSRMGSEANRQTRTPLAEDAAGVAGLD